MHYPSRGDERSFVFETPLSVIRSLAEGPKCSEFLWNMQSANNINISSSRMWKQCFVQSGYTAIRLGRRAVTGDSDKVRAVVADLR
jgi:hypothetical protein